MSNNEWQEGKPYRTEKISRKVAGRKLEIPICIPSYGRPDSAMFKILEKEPDLPMVFFIREEQKELYAGLKGKARIVTLKNVDNIGQTRAKIVKWAHKQGYENIFMFDDKVTAVNALAPRLSRNDNWSMSKFTTTMYQALQVWEYLIRKYKPCMSGGLHKGFSFSPGNINAEPEIAPGIWCAIQLNVDMLSENDINYRDSNIYGHEDNIMEIEVMQKRLKHICFKDIEFDNIPSSDKYTGGIQDTCPESETRLERVSRLSDLVEKFVGKGHPGIIFYTWKDGARYVRMNWKYWRKHYSEEPKLTKKQIDRFNVLKLSEVSKDE